MAMVLLVALLLCVADAPVNEKVLEFARSKLGERVGDGECTALAVEALRHAGAARPRPRSGVWGDELGSLRDARPGDVLQFEGAVFVRTRIGEDGAVMTRTFSFPHHTAIVARVRKRGPRPVLVVLHQNARTGDGDPRVVQELTIDLAEKRRGTIKAYRPVADQPVDPSGRSVRPRRRSARGHVGRRGAHGLAQTVEIVSQPPSGGLPQRPGEVEGLLAQLDLALEQRADLAHPSPVVRTARCRPRQGSKPIQGDAIAGHEVRERPLFEARPLGRQPVRVPPDLGLGLADQVFES
jgi:hypothetical protein